MNIYYNEKLSFFNSHKTYSYSFRINMLKNLKNTVKKYEEDILQALKLDLNKPEFESYSSEIGVVYSEIDNAINNLKKWMKPKKVSTPIFLQPARSYIYNVPKGIVLIISPWNYPFQLVFTPLVGSIAAGNCCVIKPSNKSKNTEKIVDKIISECFSTDYISVIKGPGSEVVDKLILDYDFDHIFFTGSIRVGKIISKLAAEKLTSTTLELGGKSPCIVFDDANLQIAAKNIVWGKFFNAGQTCVAPDYLLVDSKVKKELIKNIIKYIEIFYNDSYDDNYCKIIDKNNFSRLLKLLDNQSIIYGGDYNINKNMVFPTLVHSPSFDDDIMKYEIFGPILPIIEFHDFEDIENVVNLNRNPLALYLFTKNKDYINKIISKLSFGGGCVNSTLYHFVNNNLPFGGVRSSGIGRYHGKQSFYTFSNEKSIYKAGFFEFNIKYPPYNKFKLNILRKLMK